MPRQKISAYVPPDIVDKVTAFQRERDLKSLSEALEQLIKEYFDLPRTDPLQTVLDRLETIESRLSRLEQSAPQRHIQVFTPKTAPIDRTGLGRNRLAARFGISGAIVTRYQQAGRIEELSRKYDPEGIIWHYDSEQKLFIPSTQ